MPESQLVLFEICPLKGWVCFCHVYLAHRGSTSQVSGRWTSLNFMRLGNGNDQRHQVSHGAFLRAPASLGARSCSPPVPVGQPLPCRLVVRGQERRRGQCLGWDGLRSNVIHRHFTSCWAPPTDFFVASASRTADGPKAAGVFLHNYPQGNLLPNSSLGRPFL